MESSLQSLDLKSIEDQWIIVEFHKWPQKGLKEGRLGV